VYGFEWFLMGPLCKKSMWGNRDSQHLRKPPHIHDHSLTSCASSPCLSICLWWVQYHCHKLSWWATLTPAWPMFVCMYVFWDRTQGLMCAWEMLHYWDSLPPSVPTIPLRCNTTHQQISGVTSLQGIILLSHTYTIKPKVTVKISEQRVMASQSSKIKWNNKVLFI
jgi:hypothetical protein